MHSSLKITFEFFLPIIEIINLIYFILFFPHSNNNMHVTNKRWNEVWKCETENVMIWGRFWVHHEADIGIQWIPVSLINTFQSTSEISHKQQFVWQFNKWIFFSADTVQMEYPTTENDWSIGSSEGSEADPTNLLWIGIIRSHMCFCWSLTDFLILEPWIILDIIFMKEANNQLPILELELLRA